MEAQVLKEKTSTKSGISVVKKGNIVETYNKAQKVIHTIDLSNVGLKILIHSWLGFRTAEEFIEICDGHLYDLFKSNGCKKIIVDISKMTGSFDSVNDWMANTYMPKLMKIGFNCSAVVLPKDVFAQISVENWEQKVSGFTTRNFGDLNAALNWIKAEK
jgi:hypothetical protein